MLCITDAYGVIVIVDECVATLVCFVLPAGFTQAFTQVAEPAGLASRIHTIK